MKITVYAPEGGGVKPVRDALALAGVKLTVAALEPLTRHELLLAYDWAWRVHLRASDAPVRTRVKPAFLGMLEEAREAGAEARYADWPLHFAGGTAWCMKVRLIDGGHRECMLPLGRPRCARDMTGWIREHAATMKHEGD